MIFSPLSATGNYDKDVTSFLEGASSYIEKERDVFHFMATLSNLSAFIYSYFPDLNWAGFYLFDGEKLVLGPFQGEPACIEIELGRGVCGTAAEKKESRSEIVVPIIKDGGSLFGVIDIDSPLLNRFSEYERHLLEELAILISQSLI